MAAMEEKFDIPDKLTYRRKEVIRLTKLDGRVLDYWEREFQAVSPTANQEGEKFYSRHDLETILKIKQWLTVERLDKARVRELLQSENGAVPAAPPVEEESPVPTDHSLPDGKLRQLRKGLAEILTMLNKNDRV